MKAVFYGLVGLGASSLVFSVVCAALAIWAGSHTGQWTATAFLAFIVAGAAAVGTAFTYDAVAS